MRIEIALAGDDFSAFNSWRDHTAYDIRQAGFAVRGMTTEELVELYNSAPIDIVDGAYLREARFYKSLCPADYPFLTKVQREALNCLQGGIPLPRPVMTFNPRTKKYDMISGYAQTALLYPRGGTVYARWLTPEYVDKFRAVLARRKQWDSDDDNS